MSGQIYSRASSLNSVAAFHVNMLNNDVPVRFITYRAYWEGALAEFAQIIHIRTETTYSTTAYSLEVFNTRTPTSQNIYWSTHAVLGSSFNIFIYGLLAVLHASIIFSGRYAPVFQNANYVYSANFINGHSLSSSIAIVEGNLDIIRKKTRKTTKAGYFVMFGNNAGLHKKTGSGAFELTSRPHFDNDITWVDPSAWRNGMSHSDYWQLNIYGGTPALALRRIFVVS